MRSEANQARIQKLLTTVIYEISNNNISRLAYGTRKNIDFYQTVDISDV